jgi:hypothetical protein
MEEISLYNWAGSLNAQTCQALVVALSRRLEGTFTVLRQNAGRGAGNVEIYPEKTLELPPRSELGAIYYERSKIYPYDYPLLFLHTLAFATVVRPGDLIVFNPFFVQIHLAAQDSTGTCAPQPGPEIVTFFVPGHLSQALATMYTKLCSPPELPYKQKGSSFGYSARTPRRFLPFAHAALFMAARCMAVE